MPAEYAQNNASAASKLNLLGALIGVAGVGRKSFTIGNGVAEYNLNKYRKVGEGHTNRQKDLAKDMKEFLGGQHQTIYGSEGAKELITVAEEYGRRGSAIQLKSIIVDQVQNARASPHFRILRPKAMTDAELSGYRQEIVRWAYTPPTEAPEFAPPHYLQFQTEIYEGKGYRFNNGFRFNAEAIMTSQGLELLAQMASVAINNFVKLMEQIVTYCLMGVDDRYKGKKLLIDSGCQTEEELIKKYKYNGQMMGASFLAYGATVGIFQRENGLEFLMNWVKKVTRSQNVNITHMLVVPDSLIGYSFDRTDYSKRGPEAMDALYGGEEYTKSLIRRFNGVEIIEQPTYEMQDARVKVEQALSNTMEIGQHYVLDMTPYIKLRTVQAARGIDSKAPRASAAVNDLYYLDYSTDKITKRCQPFAELMRAALCWDENGELNARVYDQLVRKETLENLIEQIGLTVTDFKAFKPDPWVVESRGKFVRVDMVGNQDTYHTSVESTKLAIDIACDMLTDKLRGPAEENLTSLIEIMKQNYHVMPDDNGNTEGFWVAGAWKNVSQRVLDKNEAVWYVSDFELPDLTETVNNVGVKQAIHAYQRRDAESGQNVVCFKAPIIDTDEGPKLDVTNKVDYSAFFQTVGIANGAMHLAGYLRVGANEWVDIQSLLFATVSDANIQSLIDDYVANYVFSVNASAYGVTAYNALSAAGIIKPLPARATADMASFDYPKPSGAYTIYAATPGVSGGYDFAGKKNNSLRNRLMSVYLQNAYYKAISRKEGQYANMAKLRSNAERHPHYLWMDSRLVMNQSTGRGCVEGENIVHDPTVVDAPTNLPYFASPHHSFWSSKMAYLGYVQPSFFFRFEDLQRCKVFGVERGNIKLPGVSTLSAMRSIARQMAGSANLHGWQKVDAGQMFKTIIDGVASIDNFLDHCYRIFCPTKSGLTQKPIDQGSCFMSHRFLHHTQVTGDADIDAKRCFSNMIIPHASRLMALINPFINFPLFVNKEAVQSQADDEYNTDVVLRRRHVETTMRFTDLQAVVSATPYMIHSVAKPWVSVGLEFDPVYKDADVRRPAAYGYLSNKATRSEKQKNVEFNIMRDPSIFSVISSYTADEERFVVDHFVKALFKKLIKDPGFSYKSDIMNESESNPKGVPVVSAGDRAAHLKIAGPKNGKANVAFFTKFAELIRDSINQYPGFFTDIDEYYKALFYLVILVKNLFDYCFDDMNKRGDPKDFKLRANQKKDIAEEAEARAVQLGKMFTESSSSSSSSSGSIDAQSEQIYQQHLANLHSDFAQQLFIDAGGSSSDTRRDARKMSVTTMQLAVDATYWAAVDQNMRRLYGLPFDGIGVQFSIARPQNKYDHGFVDTVWEPSNTGAYASNASRIAKYRDLIAHGPGSSAPFNLKTLFTKFAHGSTYHKGKPNLDIAMMVESFSPNAHFMERMNCIDGDWKKQAIALAYLTARPTAELMIHLHNHCIPQPMVLIPMDPYMNFRTNSVLFVDATDQDAFLGHHLTLHTAGLDADTREGRHHISAWIFPYWPRAEKVVQVPNVAFSGVLGGTSGRIVKSIADVREFGRKTKETHNDSSDVDWDPNHPYERHADRFVNYGGGSVTADSLGVDINIVGNNRCPGSNLNCGVDLPLGLIPITPTNCMSYPSALVFNMVTGYMDLNKDADEDLMHPTSLYHVRANDKTRRTGGIWNVWCSRGKQYSVNYETGNGDVLRNYGSGPLSDLEELDGFYLKGMPKMFRPKPVSAH